MSVGAIYCADNPFEVIAVIDEVLLAQARQHLLARADAIVEMQFAPVVRRAFTFAEIRAGFQRGELARWLREGLGENVSCWCS